MATRLYPATTNTAVLEKLAGVPAGTAESHARIDSHYKKLKATLNGFFNLPGTTDEQKDNLRSIYHIIDRDEWEATHRQDEEGQQLAAYDHFLTYGWGRVMSELCDDSCGSTKDTTNMAIILGEQGVKLPPDVSLADLEGLKWN